MPISSIRESLFPWDLPISIPPPIQIWHLEGRCSNQCFPSTVITNHCPSEASLWTVTCHIPWMMWDFLKMDNHWFISSSFSTRAQVLVQRRHLGWVCVDKINKCSQFTLWGLNNLFKELGSHIIILLPNETLTNWKPN